MPSRAAVPGEAASIARTVTLAFAADPIWSVALRRSDGTAPDLEPYWRLFVDGAMAHRTIRIVDAGAAVAIWLPPGTDELDAGGLLDLERWIERELDEPARAQLHELYERFEASRAGRADHYYLSLLATHPEHRGRGVGQALLAADLATWDEIGVPAYLESTNPGNDHRYVRAGFGYAGGFPAVHDSAWVSAMWRPVGGHVGAATSPMPSSGR